MIKPKRNVQHKTAYYLGWHVFEVGIEVVERLLNRGVVGPAAVNRVYAELKTENPYKGHWIPRYTEAYRYR